MSIRFGNSLHQRNGFSEKPEGDIDRLRANLTIIAPLENVLEGILGEGKRPDVVSVEPFLEVPYVPVATLKLQ